MGCMLLFKVRIRLISIFAVLTMSFFTLLTLVIAIWNPLDDCGCFGEAIKMKNWYSFLKNLVLLPMSITVWYEARDRRIFPFTRREIICTFLFAAMAGGLGAYCWRHLPLIDMLPYKKGVDLTRDVLCTDCLEGTTRLVYADKLNGGEVEFEVTDTTWYDTTRWEYLRTVTPFDNVTPEMLENDFAIYDGDENITARLLDYSGTTYMICVREIEALDRKCEQRFARIARRGTKRGAQVFCLTSELSGEIPERIAFDGYEVACYRMPQKVLSLLMRADLGLVEVRDGVIVRKRTCWDAEE